MKVTKLIREYVVKKVNENYPKTEAELAYEKHADNISNAIKEANEIVFEYAKKIAEELNARYGFPNDSKLKPSDYYNAVSSRSNYESEIYRASRIAREERQKKVAEKIEEILITLELGGSKADLDEMLKNIGK